MDSTTLTTNGDCVRPERSEAKSNGYERSASYRSDQKLGQELVREISARKNEPSWMLDFRLAGLDCFFKKPMPSWGPSLEKLDINDICYYLKSVDKPFDTWAHVPKEIKETFDKLGVPEAEKSFLAGLGAQYESEMVYHNLKKEWEDQGVLFLDTDTALQKHPDLVKQYFASVVPVDDNKFASLNTAVWSGGSFIYVPPCVNIDIPLQAHFQINQAKMGQFERTLIIADEGSIVTYVEGCTAPYYTSTSLHSAVVEIIAKKGAQVRYMTIQNWSKNVYNLVTKRAFAFQDSCVEWIDGNLGSGITMKYPAVILKETGAKTNILSIALASSDQQIQDSGGKVIHQAPGTNSHIVSKSISSCGGQTTYRGMVKVEKQAHGCKSYVQCDSLILDQQSRADAYPYIESQQSDVAVAHEATVSKINDEQVFYLMSRGLDKNAARLLVVNGFIEPFVTQLPMEFAIEMNRLVQLEMEKSHE